MRWVPVFRKEMRLYFGSPVAYVVFTFFLVISGWFFSQIFLFYSDASMRSLMQPQFGQNLNVVDNVMRPLFTNMSVVLLFFIPMLTMRLFAEEKKSGTMELLLTYPVRDGEVLAGKYLAAFALYLVNLFEPIQQLSQLYNTLQQAGVPPTWIKLVDIGFGVQPLLVKQVDAIMGFSMNEPIEAESGGMAVSLMPISDYGVNTYGLTIVSNPDFMQQKPEVVKAFMRATLRSVAETVKNPAGALSAVAAAVAETDAKREAKVLEHTVPYWQSKETESGGFGWQTEQRWRDTIDVARKLGLIESALRTEDVFVNTYLSK